MKNFKRILATLVFVASFVNTTKAQTTLAAGDIVFTGVIGRGATTADDAFSFVLLKAVAQNTVIKFTDYGWRTGTNSFNSGGAATETEAVLTVTAAAGLPAGTEIMILNTSATLVGGGSAGTLAFTSGTAPDGSTFLNTGFSLNGTNGDQVFAYQGTMAAPTFIAGLHWNVYRTSGGDPTNTTDAAWDGVLSGIYIQASTSEKPAALTAGTNALWIYDAADAVDPEKGNGRFNCGSDVSTVANARANVCNRANWTVNDNNGPAIGFTLPTGCNYLGILSAPTINTNPSSTSICEGTNASFSITATNATGYQWEVNPGSGFINVVNNATYSGATTATLNITAATVSMNSYQYRCIASNGVGSATSTAATLTVTALPVNPTLLAKTPAASTVADGTPVSATFNAGSGGTGCSDDFRYTTNGGVSYLPYTPGSNISTTGLAAGTGVVTIEGRRNNCSAGCQNNYVALATWIVTPLPAAATTLNAGDIAFSAYAAANDEFSFVLLRNIGPGTVVNFTTNGWLSTNVFRTGEETVTWTSAAAYSAGTEIKISGLTATLASGGSAGTVTGTALTMSTSGDQILAYRGTAASPTFITGIHMNVYSVPLFGDPTSTTAAAWDGAAYVAAVNTNASALPTGLTTGVNCIWVGVQDVNGSEYDNAAYGNCANPATLGSISILRAALNNPANWQKNDNTPLPLFSIPTGCPYLGVGNPPNITVNPANSSVCELVGTSFSITVSGATAYQWQVDNGGGFVNVTDNATYSGSSTATLSINATPLSLNGYLYRCIASNGSGSSTSTNGTLTVTALPVSPSIATKTPTSTTVADGTPVSATFNAGSGGTGCSDDYRYTTDGGTTYLPYTPGSNISTTGLAAGSGFVFIEGRRANCSAGCQGTYKVLAMWRVTPIPVAATTLNAGDIAFSAYSSTSTNDDFSFVLLRNIGPGTTINFTDNGWKSTNVFEVGEQTVTWTAPAGGLPGGTEITISGLTATRSGGGAAGTVTGTALSLSTVGDQVLAYRGTAAAPTFISGIHMNLYSTTNGDAVSTTAAAWDGVGTANTFSNCALPTGLTTGVNCIWIGVQDVPGSEYDNAKYGNCSSPALNGSLVALRTALNNQANWQKDNSTPPLFTQPTGCNYLNVLCPTITVTNPATATGTAGTPFSQSFSASGGLPSYTYTTASTLPTGLTLSAAGVLSGTPTQGGTFPIVVTATDASGCTGNGATYTLVIGCPANSATATPSSQTICSDSTITTIVLSGGLATTTYNWTRDNNVSVTGIAASGSGDISGALTNTTGSPVTVTFTITPVIYGCNGTTTTATVIVNPTANAVATPSSQAICSGATITTIALTSAVSGTTFNWTRDNTGTVTGIAGSGSGNISGALTNTTNAPITVTFTITPVGTCPGSSITATVVVNPIPDATATPASQSRCSGAGIQPILMSGNVSGTTFNWTRDQVGTIGGTIPASGSGNISGNLVNNTGSPVTVTFTITPTANGCPGTPITATVTVNPLPLAVINGGGGSTVCQNSNYVLSATTDPGYTYAWGRSLFTNPFTPLGTAATQPIDVSGNYLLTVTNQYGCVDTAMTTKNIADYSFNGSLVAGDAVQTGRLNRFATISTCAAPKGCPGAFTTTGNRLYDSYTITNQDNVPVCATIGINSYCATNIFCAAYLGSYNPTSVCTNYLADPGSSFTTSGFYEATIPANGTIVVVVHEVNTGTGCSGYNLTVNIPRDNFITVTPNDTVCSGTAVVLTAPAGNNYTWTPGGATTRSITVTPPVGTATYSVQSGYGNYGCTANLSQDIVVNTLPTANAVSNQYFCDGSNAVVNFSGTGSPTYNWTNTNTAIGLPASGSGDLNFTAANSTGAPISGTITVTPVNGSCTGTPITFTITVANSPFITSVTEDSVCAPGGIVNLAAVGSGLINWYDSLTGGHLVNTGATFAPNITATTTYYVESRVNTPAATTLLMPGQSNTFPGNTRGYWFTAPVDFVITALRVPTTASSGPQNIAVLKFNGNTPPPVFSATTNAFVTLFQTRQNTSIGNITCNIPVKAGEVIGILGSRGGINTYAPGDYVTSIFGNTVQLERMGMQFPLETTNPQNIWREFGATTSISRIEFDYTNVSCTSSPRVPVTGTVLPQPVATATPASQTVCSGAITPIALTSSIAGTTFAWTRDNTGTVTGIAANGTGNNISGTLTNTTTSPVTVTFTITPTSPDGCVGPNITATVLVQAKPTVTCPAPITVNTDPNLCTAVVTYSSTITGIPVPVVTYTFTGATTGTGSGTGSGSAFNQGTTTVKIKAENICGADSCTFNISVNDAQAPSITCPGPVTVACASAVPAVNTASVTASDNCPGVVVTHISDVISGQTCANRYTLTRTYRATDAVGNFTECTQIITVFDNIAPVLTCPAPVTVSCASAVPPVNVLAVTGVSDNCGGPVTVTHISDVISGQTCANRYTITRTYRATDACGNFTECTQIITVNDQTPPTLTCPAPVTVSCAGDVPPANIASVTGVSDNCAGAVTVTWGGDVISNQICDNKYTITRTYRATDVCGNFAECTQVITVDDQTPPTMTCPAPVTVSCASAVPVPNVNDVSGLSDNCGTLGGPIVVTHISDVISGQTCTNRYTITRTYRATDACGNFAECTQTITVNDQTAPVITCPAPVTVSCASAVPAPAPASLTVSDNCGGTITVIHVSDVISNQTCANRYTITRTYRATDACGNTATCTQIITVNDITPPTMTCPAPVTVSCASAVPAPSIASVIGVSDNCGGTVTVTHVGDVITNQTCTNRYTITRTYRATDACGNFTECTQIITVNDQTAPVITCPAPVTVSCASAVPAPSITSVTATDNCGGGITITHQGDVITNQTCANRYTINRTYRATDACGNFAECTQVITVNDVTPPTITCPGPVTVCSPGAVPPANIASVTATDNCVGVVVVTFVGDVANSPSAIAPYTITRTYRATDVCGNSATCTQTITVNPVPTVNAVASQTLCNSALTAAINFTGVVTAPGITYRWVNSTPSIGLAATGTGDIAPFNAINTGTATVVATVTVTPEFTNAGLTCFGAPTSFTITVLPPTMITAQPVSQTFCFGGNASFSVTATGLSLTYQWQRSANGVSPFVDMPGEIQPTLTIQPQPNPIGFSGNQYRCVVTGQCGTVTSNAATLTINPLPNITQVNVPPRVCLSDTIVTLRATPTGGVWSGAGTSSTGIFSATGAGLGQHNITYTVTNSFGCTATQLFKITVNDCGERHNRLAGALRLWPNPSGGRVSVRFNTDLYSDVVIRVRDILSKKVVYEGTFKNLVYGSVITLDLRNLASATYILEAYNGSDKTAIPFVIAH